MIVNDDDVMDELAQIPKLPLCDLYVRNKRDEFICSLEAFEGPTWWPDRMVITGYCRDPEVMNIRSQPFSLGSTTTSVVMHCHGSMKNISGYVSYLRDRNKAGFTDPSGDLQYFLLSGLKAGEVVMVRRRLRAAFVARPRGATSVPAAARSGRPGPGPVAPPVPVARPPPDGKSDLERFREAAKSQLQRFVSDAEEASLAFPAMDEKRQFVLLDEVSDYPELIDQLEGEMIDERHIVVYKKDRLPKDVAIRVGLYVRPDGENESEEADSFVGLAAKGKKRPVVELHGEVVATGIGVEKRDRRTVTEVMKATAEAKHTDC